MIRSKAENEEYFNLETTSLADIIFLLLLFFIMSSTLIVSKGLKLNLPVSQNGKAHSDNRIRIVLNRKGHFIFNGRMLTPKVLVRKLKNIISRDNDVTERTVILFCAREIDLGRAIASFDLLRSSGIRNVNIAVEEKNIQP